MEELAKGERVVAAYAVAPEHKGVVPLIRLVIQNADLEVRFGVIYMQDMTSDMSAIFDVSAAASKSMLRVVNEYLDQTRKETK